MVCFGGLEFIAAGYLLAEHSKRKKKEEQQRLEEEEQEAARAHSMKQSSRHHHQRRHRRYSDSEREEKRHRERTWGESQPRKEYRDDGYRPHKEKRRDDSRHYRTSSPPSRHASPLPSKSHMSRSDKIYDGNHISSSTHLNRLHPPRYPSQQSTSYLALPQFPAYGRSESDPPPRKHSPHTHHSHPVHHPQATAPASHHNQMIPAHQQIHNSIFPLAPPSFYRQSPLSQPAIPMSQAVIPQNARPSRGPGYPTYHPPSPPSPPPPASALSSHPQYATPPPYPSPLALPPPPPPPEGVWELQAGDMNHHPNPARRRASSTSNRPHVHFADGLDVHENIADAPPPYQAY